jgi:hypothetical protein
LYPACQKYGKYPIKHPEIITENFGDVNDYFGIIKCTILPPQKLHIPVLPTKINGKLVFTLCNKCACETLERCTHSERERAITYTWCTPEIQKALEKGYSI